MSYDNERMLRVTARVRIIVVQVVQFRVVESFPYLELETQV